MSEAIRVRVMTYNILYGGVGREPQIREIVQEINPDVAVFCEVTEPRAFDSIAEAVGPHRAVSGSGRERTAIVSRWPLGDVETFGPPWSRKKWVHATATIHGTRIGIGGVHFVPQPFWPCEILRRREAGALVQHLQARAHPLHVIAGDFNAFAAGDRLRGDATPLWIRAQFWLQAGRSPRWALTPLTESGYVDCYRARNPADDGFTVPAWDPHVRIDYVFASPSLAGSLQSAGTLQRSLRVGPPPRRSLRQLLGRTSIPSLAGEASDHLPVWADFEWPPRGSSNRHTKLTKETKEHEDVH